MSFQSGSKGIYDEISQNYIAHVERELSWNNLYERPYMCSIFADFKGCNVVDVGASTGFYSLYAQRKGAHVTAVDISEKMLDYIKERDKTGLIKTVQADLVKGLPFIETASQDYIICSLMIHYLADWDFLLSEFHRILKSQGRVYISTHHPILDYIHTDRSDYHVKEVVTDEWGTDGNSFNVEYYSRSLSEILTPFIESRLKVIKIDEPRPQEKCKELSLKAYEKFNTSPVFLFFILEKE